MEKLENILYEVERGRARITLNRPEKRNALSVGLLEEMSEVLWEADNDREVHAVVLRGAGKSFSAGYDLTPPRVRSVRKAAPTGAVAASTTTPGSSRRASGCAWRCSTCTSP